jgi:[acyl-carrier-protein] S-malonyltransferase
MKTAFLFTGQGSQFAGMGKDLMAFPVAQETLQAADEALGEPLTRLCLEGPEEQLALTVNTQPATLAVSIAAYRALGQTPDLAAGHSLGEYSALTAAGSFEFTDVVQLVRQRAEFMQEAVPIGTGGMVVLRKMTLAQAHDVVAQIDKGVCDLANFNAPGQYVVSGEAAAMDQVCEVVGRRSAMRLAVSVPFHSSLLAEAAERYASVLDDVAMQDPVFPIYCNVDAVPVTTAAAARDALKRQFARPVLWQESMQKILRDEGVRRFVEFGPKAVLLRMVTQIAKDIDIEDVETAAVTTATEVESLKG